MAISKQKENTLKAVKRLGEGTQSRAGLGVDIIEIERMEQILVRTPRFMQRVFSEGERKYAMAKARPAIHFALFFAAKEAVLKALGTGFTGMAFTDVEVTHDRHGRPEPILHGNAAKVASEQGVVEVELSLSYTHQVGVASAVAIKSEDRPRKDERKDPMEELQQQFKEMRSMLDNMDERIRELSEGSETAVAEVEAEDEEEGESDVEDDASAASEDETAAETTFNVEKKTDAEAASDANGTTETHSGASLSEQTLS